MTRDRMPFGVVSPVSLAALVLIGFVLSGCADDEAPISSRTSNYQAVDEDAPAPSAAFGGDGDDMASVTDGTASTLTVPPSQPVPVPVDSLDPYTVPEGEPEELLAFAQQLSQRQPRGLTRDEMLADFTKIQDARIATAEKILAADVEEEIRFTAVQIKLDALGALSELDVPGSPERLIEFCQTIRDDHNADIARTGRLLLFGSSASEFDTAERKDTKPLIDELKALLEDEQVAAEVFSVGQQVASQLFQSGYKETTIEIFKLLGRAFVKSENQSLADAARQLLEYAYIIELNFNQTLTDVQDDKPGGVKALMELIPQLLAEETAGVATFDALSNAGYVLEAGGHYSEAGQLYMQIGQAYESHQDASLVAQAKQKSEYGQRRVGLIGKPFRVEGIQADGGAFDWTQYRGKVVLVDFWATWCGPCMAELPNVIENYELYHDKGFEVVGVNVNDQNDPAQRQQMDQFFAQRQLPWTTVVSDDPKAQGFEDPNMTNCGVEGIPFMVLVDQQGVAVALHARGPKLGELLASLLGPVDGEPAEPPVGDSNQPATDPPADATGDTSRWDRPIEQATYFVSLQDDTDEDDANEDEDSTSNPYLARPDLAIADLVDFIFDMQEKPKSIQARPGFGEAVVEAADRVLAADARDKYQLIAAEAKFEILHKMASTGDKAADQRLAEFVAQMKDDSRERIARQVRFFTLERRAIEADQLPLEEIPDLLAELKEFLANDKPLTARHLRIASRIVRAINRLDDPEDLQQRQKYATIREVYFVEFGNLFATANDKQLAGYGRRLATSPAAGSFGELLTNLIGKPVELEGVTAAGVEFRWQAYRGKVVIVDFWATWCGPCLAAMPLIKAFYEQHKADGFDVVGVSLDKDLDALGKFLQDNAIDWANLVGEESQSLAAKYDVRGIPTMLLIDKQGAVVAASHLFTELAAKAEHLLAPAEAESSDEPAAE